MDCSSNNRWALWLAWTKSKGSRGHKNKGKVQILYSQWVMQIDHWSEKIGGSQGHRLAQADRASFYATKRKP